MVGYYSNRLSYEEVSLLLERLSGQPLLSDQKAEQVVVESASSMSESLIDELARFEQEGRPMPSIKQEVDRYHGQDIALGRWDTGQRTSDDQKETKQTVSKGQEAALVCPDSLGDVGQSGGRL